LLLFGFFVFVLTLFGPLALFGTVEDGFSGALLIGWIGSLTELELEETQLVESDTDVVLFFIQHLLDHRTIDDSKTPIGNQNWWDGDDIIWALILSTACVGEGSSQRDIIIVI